MVKWEHNNFLGGFDQKGNGSKNSKARVVSSCHRVQLMTTVPCGSMVFPVFWGEYPRAFPSFSYKKGKRESDNWDAQGQMGSSKSPLKP